MQVSFTLKPSNGVEAPWVTYSGEDLAEILAAAETDLDRGSFTRVEAVGTGYRGEVNLARGLGATVVPDAELDAEAAEKAEHKNEVRAAATVGPIFYNVPFNKKDEAKALGALWAKEQKKWGTPDPDVAKKLDDAGFKRS